MPLKNSTGRYQCEHCDKSYTTKWSCNRHEKSHFKKFNCKHCNRAFTQNDNKYEHEKRCGDTAPTVRPSYQRGGINNAIQDRTFYPRRNHTEQYDLLTFLGNVRQSVHNFLQNVLNQHAIKWYTVSQVILYRENRDGEIVYAMPFFRSVTYTSIGELDESDLNQSFQKMFAGLEKYIRESSGWIVKRVRLLKVHTTQYAPLGGSSFLELPRSLKQNGHVLNIRNEDDNKCFLWCTIDHLNRCNENRENVEN